MFQHLQPVSHVRRAAGASPGGPGEGAGATQTVPFPLIGRGSSGCHLRKSANLSGERDPLGAGRLWEDAAAFATFVLLVEGERQVRARLIGSEEDGSVHAAV